MHIDRKRREYARVRTAYSPRRSFECVFFFSFSSSLVQLFFDTKLDILLLCTLRIARKSHKFQSHLTLCCLCASVLILHTNKIFHISSAVRCAVCTMHILDTRTRRRGASEWTFNPNAHFLFFFCHIIIIIINLQLCTNIKWKRFFFPLFLSPCNWFQHFTLRFQIVGLWPIFKQFVLIEDPKSNDESFIFFTAVKIWRTLKMPILWKMEALQANKKEVSHQVHMATINLLASRF